MPYVAIPDPLIEIGQPTKKEIFQRIKDNQESFNSDIEALKQTAAVDIFNIRYTGLTQHYSGAEFAATLPTYKAPVGGTITSFIITLLTSSTSGNLEVTIEKSIDNGINWSPLLTAPVTLTGTTIGSVSGAVPWIDIPSQSFNQNDLLRLNINGVQVQQGNFHISVYGELS